MDKTCGQYQDFLVDYNLGILSDEDTDSLNEHLNGCPECREYLQALEKQKRLLSQFEDYLQAKIEAQQQKVIETIAGKKQELALRISLWRTIMKNPGVKIAAAAIIIGAILIGINHFGGSVGVTGVAWGKLAERINKIDTVSYRMLITDKYESGRTEGGEVFVSQSSEYGILMKSFENGKLVLEVYSLPQKKLNISLFHIPKKYLRQEITEDQMNQFPRIEDPRKWLNSLLSETYRKLGRRIIDGVEAEGIEAENPQFNKGAFEECRVQLWVDIKNELPVQLLSEGKVFIEGKGAYTFTMVFDNFQWEVELASSLFEPPVIPDDYTEWEVPKQLENRNKTDK